MRYMKTLVGVPIFAVPDLVRSCLSSLVRTPADVLVIDNCSPPDVRAVVDRYKVTTIVNTVNGYCNGGWNQIMKYGLENNYDVIGLGSSDVEMHPGWYDLVTNRMSQFPNEIILPSVGEPVQDADYTKGIEVEKGTAGFFTFFRREAIEQVYPIPSQIRHWFGDEYMFTKLRKLGWKTVIMPDLLAYHQWSAITAQNPEAYKVIEEDKKAWQALGGTVVFAEMNHDSEKGVDNGHNGTGRKLPVRIAFRKRI